MKRFCRGNAENCRLENRAAFPGGLRPGASFGLALALALAAGLPPNAAGGVAALRTDNLAALSFDELMQTKVSTVYAASKRELLEKTLNGSIKLLTDVLSMSDPQAFGVGQKLRELMQTFVRSLKQEKTWELELAAMLSQIGYVTVPAVVLQKLRAGFTLPGPERDMIDRVPEVGARLLAHIPRLESVAQIIRYQAKHYDGTGFPPDGVKGDDLPVGARIMKVLLDLHHLEAKGTPRFKALEQMRARPGWYDPKVLEAAMVCFDIYLPEGQVAEHHRQALTLRELRVGHILAERVESKDGVVIAGAGTQVTQMVLEKLQNFAQITGLKEPIQVEV